jgi:hypothetical protein
VLIWVYLIISILVTAFPGAGSGATSPESRLVNRIVAAVNNEVITLRELEMECEFQLIIQGKKGPSGSLSPDHSRDFRQGVLEGMINQILILEEAQRTGLAEVDKEELAGKLRDFQQRFTSESEFSRFLNKWGLSRKELEGRFKAQIIVTRFMERVITPLSESEGEVREKEQERIAAFQEQLTRKVEELRAKADIRLMGTIINPKH